MDLTHGRTDVGAERSGMLHRLAVIAMCVAMFAAVAAAGTSWAQAPAERPAFAEPRDDAALYVVESALSGLDGPACVVVRPGSEGLGAPELFIAESGAGRVVRWTPGDAKPATAVGGFPVRERSDLLPVKAGPLGLAFLSRNRLAVGTGGLGLGRDVIRVYGLPDDNAEVIYDAPDHTVGPLAGEGERTGIGAGSYASLAVTERALLATPWEGDPRGWILRATLEANQLAGLESLIEMHTATGLDGATCVTIDPRPRHGYLVVGQAGAATRDSDSLLSFFSPSSGALAMSLATGLRDIVALAYSPTGDLYAADASWSDPTAGGVYRLEAALVDGRQSCQAVKVASVTRPASLAFTAGGELFVAALGGEPADGSPSGVLVKVVPKAETPKL